MGLSSLYPYPYLPIRYHTISHIIKSTQSIFYKKKPPRGSYINRQKELQLLQYQFDETDEGNEFINTEHDFSNDLDLFGHKSLSHISIAVHLC